MSSEEYSSNQRAFEEPQQEMGDLLPRLFDALARRKWYILFTIPIVAVGAVVVALKLPAKYESEALVGIAGPKVSERYVASDNTPVADTVAALQRQILSRASLTKIAEQMDIYGDGTSPMEQAERLQGELDVQPIATRPYEVSALHIAFISNNPSMAQRVTSRIVDLFLEENQQNREDRVTSTKSFFSQQVRAAEQRLAAQEAKIQYFKSRNLGQLPDQQPMNLQILSDLRNRRQSISIDLERTRRARREIESDISGRLARLQSERDDLLKKFQPQYPAVQKKDAEIAQYTALLEGGTATGLEDVAVRQLRSRLDQNKNEIEDLTREEKDLQAQLNEHQGRVSTAPLREQELSELTRDYNLLKNEYEDLKSKEMQSGLSADLETSQRGQQFHVIEHPTLPIKPVSPNRLRVGMMGLVLGIVAGIVLAFARDLMDPSFQSERALKAEIEVPLVIGIPLMLTPKEQSRQRLHTVMGWVGTVAAAAIVIGAEAYLFVNIV